MHDSLNQSKHSLEKSNEHKNKQKTDNKDSLDIKQLKHSESSISENTIFENIDKILSFGKSIFSNVTKFCGKLTGKYEQSVEYLRDVAEKIARLRPKMIKLSDDELKAYTKIFKNRLKKESLDSILIEAFAVAREAARRVLNEEPYLVQLMGGIALHTGRIAEMHTGEGKTLVALLPAYLNALTGHGVHIVTVNDYLATRDSKLIGRVFEFLELTVGCVTSDLSCDIKTKKSSYAADITYITNTELGFDYLKDNMAKNKEGLCQRSYSDDKYPDQIFHYAIIDEADSILIDEARTPLIMSAAPNIKKQESLKEEYMFANSIVTSLCLEDYEINLKEHDVTLTDSGVKKVDLKMRSSDLLGKDNTVFLPQYTKIMHRIIQCLKAHHLYIRDKDYIVKKTQKQFGGEDLSIKIVDEYTGRILEGRRYSDGLHQAIEAKESARIKPETEIMASVTYRCLFKLYKKIAGMTGTAITESEEFEKIYNLECIQIPTNKPSKRKDHSDMLCGSEQQKVAAIVELVKQCHNKGQPVLLGTINVSSADYYYKHLINSGIPPIYINVLSAKHHEKEAQVIANAGRLGSITVVTNMAGRGTDIKLGGDFNAILKEFNITEAEEIESITQEINENKNAVIKAGGLYVIGTERNESRRTDDQLRGRAARQGDPGETIFFVGPEDKLLVEYDTNISTKLRWLFSDEPEQIYLPQLTTIQESIEAMHFESRHTLQKYADIKEFYMLQFYKKRKAILMRSIVDDLIADFYRLLEDEESVKWFTEKNPNYTKKTLIEKFNDRINSLKEEKAEYLDNFLRSTILDRLEEAWSSYLNIMSHSRDAASFQSYAQKDPIMYFAETAEKNFKLIILSAFYGIFYSLIEAKEDRLDEDDEFSDKLINIFNDSIQKNINFTKSENFKSFSTLISQRINNLNIDETKVSDTKLDSESQKLD